MGVPQGAGTAEEGDAAEERGRGAATRGAVEPGDVADVRAGRRRHQRRVRVPRPQHLHDGRTAGEYGRGVGGRVGRWGVEGGWGVDGGG